MSKVLDRKRPYGEVYGEGATHAFEQDGLAFDHEGKQLAVAGLTGHPQATGDPAAAPAPAPAPGGLQHGTHEADAVGMLLNKKGADVIDELPDFSDEFLARLKPVEQQGRGRQAVMVAIDAELERRAKLVDQVNAQLEQAGNVDAGPDKTAKQTAAEKKAAK